jgi:hypothetical protein
VASTAWGGRNLQPIRRDHTEAEAPAPPSPLLTRMRSALRLRGGDDAPVPGSKISGPTNVRYAVPDNTKAPTHRQ